MGSNAQRRIIPVCLARVGDPEPIIIEFLSITLEETGLFTTTVSSERLSPEPAFDALRRQYEAARLLSELLRTDNPAGELVLGITEVDLFQPVFTYLFGQAQFKGRAAVISSHRLGQQFYGLPPDDHLLLSRCEKEALHELGHTLGLVHCTHYACVMHFSNTVERVDLKGSSFCPACQKLLDDKIAER